MYIEISSCNFIPIFGHSKPWIWNWIWIRIHIGNLVWKMFELAYEREEQVVELLFHLVRRPRHRRLQAGPPGQPERSWLFRLSFKGTVTRDFECSQCYINLGVHGLKRMRDSVLHCTYTELCYEKNSFIWWFIYYEHKKETQKLFRD